VKFLIGLRRVVLLGRLRFLAWLSRVVLDLILGFSIRLWKVVLLVRFLVGLRRVVLIVRFLIYG